MKEGNSFTRLLKLMLSEGYNKDVNIVIGHVKKASPLGIDMGEYVIGQSDFYRTKSVVDSAPKIGDKMLILIDGNDFYVIDKVV